jgi:hypothetical protein
VGGNWRSFNGTVAGFMPVLKLPIQVKIRMD